MMKTLKISTFAAAASIAAACSAQQAPPPAMFLTAEDMPAAPTLCEEGEQQIFSGSSTQDEFGYGIAVCVKDAGAEGDDLIAIVFSGEGGNLRTQCLASECDGVIEFKRYTRARFTELTLTWRDEYAQNRLIETFNAEDPDSEPSSSVAHYWLSDSNKEAGYEEVREELAGYEPLSLLALDQSLPGN